MPEPIYAVRIHRPASEMEDIMGLSRLVNRNVTSTSGRTSMRLEPELWAALEEICHREGMTLADLVKSIEHWNPSLRALQCVKEPSL